MDCVLHFAPLPTAPSHAPDAPDRTAVLRLRHLGELSDEDLIAHLLSKATTQLDEHDLLTPFDQILFQTYPRRRDMLRSIAAQESPVTDDEARTTWIPFTAFEVSRSPPGMVLGLPPEDERPPVERLVDDQMPPGKLLGFVREQLYAASLEIAPPAPKPIKRYKFTLENALIHRPKKPNATGIRPGPDDTHILYQVWASQKARKDAVQAEIMVDARWLAWSKQNLNDVVRECRRRTEAAKQSMKRKAKGEPETIRMEDAMEVLLQTFQLGLGDLFEEERAAEAADKE